MATKEELIREFARLRRGWGLESEDLAARIGPALTALFEIVPGTEDRRIRDAVMAQVERISGGFPHEDRLALRFGLGAGPGVQGSSLTGRIQRLADDNLHCSMRTARRRVTRAFKRLAEESASARSQPRAVVDDPDKGWHLRRMETLLRLDIDLPEVIETRTITADRDGLKQISARVSLSRNVVDSHSDLKLWAEVQYGAAIQAREKQGETHFRFILDLPRVLQRGQDHKYAMEFRTPPDQPRRPYYAITPLVDCEFYQLRIRFDPSRPPSAVWRFQGLPPRSLDDLLIPGDQLRLDDACEVVQEFVQLDRGFSYGIGWIPWTTQDAR
ncbi:MAG TPA: hypothetical protein VGX23_23370 [Actinocrinis sp.]|nr:hypothetical protein [Actinocrinis sp.]